MIEEEEKIQSNVLKEACEYAEVPEEAFIESLQHYMMDPLVKQDLFKLGL